jgi:two-component system nitrate/nitrite response regulator NarL
MSPNAPSSVSVLIVDDHALIADTMKSSLSSLGDFTVVTAIDQESGLSAISEHGPFGVVLMDYNMPGSDPISMLQKLMDANGGRVALFSGIAKSAIVEEAMRHGAIGYIPKTIAFNSMKHALRMMADGETFLPSDFLLRDKVRCVDLPDLKDKEEAVLKLLTSGMTNKEIARDLAIDETTIKMHVRTLFRKFGVTNRTQVVLAAQKLDFV